MAARLGVPSSRRVVAAVIALAWVRVAAADSATSDRDAATPQAADVAGFGFRGRLEWLSAASTVAFRDTPVNPQNRALLLPQATAQTELRPDLRVERGTDLVLVARPRLLAQASKAALRGYGGDWQPEVTDASAEWLELYGSWRVDDRLSIAYGLQNFQWGPAELMSPSSRIFHETGFTRDPLYAVRGKHLARVNLSSGRSWSAVVLAELRANGDEPFIAGEPFEPKGEVKLEWSAASGRGYLGVTGGAGKRTRGFFGEYGAISIGDGLSVYADAVHQAGSRAWVPALVPAPSGPEPGAPEIGVPAFRQSATRAGLRTLAVGGVRYTFAGGADVRLEYLFDEAGWSEAQLALAARAVQATTAAGSPEERQAAVAAYVSPGFELVGRQHAYVSVALPDLPPAKRTQVHLRALAALEDGSAAAFGTVSVNATDSLVVFASAALADGARDAALSRLLRGMATVGAVMSW